jgi:hypothetical protein
MDSDPRSLVAAPVRHALTRLMIRGTFLVGAIGALAVWMVVARPDASARDGATFLGIILLALYSIVVRSRRSVRGRPSLEDRELAWTRAQELDRDETTLALFVVAWVPTAVCVSLAILLWPHFTDASPQIASAWVVFGAPPSVFVWMVMAGTWLDSARDDLARAEREADVRFRSYWANLGR